MNDQLDLFSQRKHRKPSQAHKILEYMMTHGSITDMDAFNVIRCRRLAARIFELKHVFGWNIITITEPHDGGTHARYVLKV